MSTVRTKTLVLGDSGTLANNLQWKVPGVPDGTLTLEREDGTDVLVVDATGVGARFKADFSDASQANRVAFQSSVVNGNTGVNVIPNGTSVDAAIAVWNNSGPTDASATRLATSLTTSTVDATRNGAGAFLPLAFNAGGAERMRIATNGVVSMPILQPEALRIPTVGFSTSTDSIQLTAGPGSRAFSVASGVVSGQIGFFAAGNSVGSITTTSAATSYNTTSDYRLKEGIAPIYNSLNRMMQLKPCGFTWKPDGSYDESFIAHELQEVCPRAVTGKKDAVKEDGTPDYQQIDPSKVVALLTAAMQEQQHIIQGQHSIIQDLQQRVANLEASK